MRRTGRKRALLVARAVMVALALAVAASCSRPALDEPDCLAGSGLCEARAGERRVRLEVLPRPVPSMKELQFILDLTPPLPTRPYPDRLLLELSMPGMYMGSNTVALRRTDTGYAGKGAIPRCPSGKRYWRAAADIPEVGPVEFFFHVED